MNEALPDALQYFGAAAATLAAFIVALDLGRRVTGWAFVLFVASSSAFNATGVYRYLIRKGPV